MLSFLQRGAVSVFIADARRPSCGTWNRITYRKALLMATLVHQSFASLRRCFRIASVRQKQDPGCETTFNVMNIQKSQEIITTNGLHRTSCHQLVSQSEDLTRHSSTQYKSYRESRHTDCYYHGEMLTCVNLPFQPHHDACLHNLVTLSLVHLHFVALS